MSGDSTDPRRVPVRDDLIDVEPYGAPQLDVRVRLNTNETADPPPAAFVEDVAARLSELELHRYPDRPAVEVRRRLGELEDLPTEQVWVANGSNEILLQLFQSYGGPGRRILLLRPGYSAHPLIARVAGTDVVEHDLPDDFVLRPEDARDAVTRTEPDLVVVANPNNPTGVAVSPESLRALHDAGEGLLVVDEAYVEFGARSARTLLDDLPRLAVTRTFSKALRLAGLRFGYLLAPSWVVKDLRRVRLPYHVDAIKQAAALAALDHRGALLSHVVDVVAERERLGERLEAIDGVRTWPSTGNFILFRTEVEDLFHRLLDRGVLVRDFSTKPRLEGCLRVTVGTPEENDAFLSALDDAVADHTPS